MDKFNAILKQLAAIWKRISFTQRVSIVLVAIVAFVGLWVFASLSHRPSMTMLYPQALDPADAAAIADKLRDEGVKFEVRDGGRRLYVAAHLVNELRLTMAAAGLPAEAGGSGWGDIFDKGGLGGKSETEVNIGKLRALQGELSQTISALASVQSVRVHLVMPEESLFKQDQKPAKASVLLSLRPGYDLGPAEISGIRYLCASAIEGLQTNNITILDNSGRILAKPRENDSMLDDGSEQYALTRQIERQFDEKIGGLLDKALGPNNSWVEVSVELDNQSLHKELTKSSEGATLEEEIVETKSDSTKPGQGGEPGAVPNITAGADTGGGSGGRSSDASTTTRTRTAPSTETTQLIVPPGALKRVSASVFINVDRKPTTADGQTVSIAQVEELVKAVIMYDETRNDLVSVQELSFYEAPASAAELAKPPSAIMTSIARHGPAAIISIALLGFLWIVMKKVKYADAGAGPKTAPSSASGGGRHAGGLDIPEPIASSKKVQEIFSDIELEEGEAELRGLREAMAKLADQKPESVAAVIRQWVR
jgi:flagellar M-ring protein FliF